MFKWLATMFTPSVNRVEKEASKTLSSIQPKRLTPKKKDLAIPAGKVKKEATQKLSGIEKTVTKNGVGFAPKIEPVITEVKAVKVTKASLSKLTKVKLEEFALATYGVDIDRRKKKDELVKEVLKLSKKV
jgi:hypothetical protein